MFIRYDNFKVVIGTKKESMKPNSIVLSGQRETICHEERNRGLIQTLNFFSGFLLWFQRACLLVLSPQLGIWCEIPFRILRQNGGCSFHLSLHFRDWCSIIVMSLGRLTLKPVLSPDFRLMSGRGHIRFRWFHTCVKIWDLRLFFQF